jgi:hypothetical protein
MLKTNAGYIIQCPALGLRFQNENLSIPGLDSRRASMRLRCLRLFLSSVSQRRLEMLSRIAATNNHYVNSSGHLVHSPSCGEEPQAPTAEC